MLSQKVFRVWFDAVRVGLVVGQHEKYSTNGGATGFADKIRKQCALGPAPYDVTPWRRGLIEKVLDASRRYLTIEHHESSDSTHTLNVYNVSAQLL